jgi:hypothetical protein
MSVPEACEVLGIGQARFHALRTQWLQEALGLLEPRPLGRPPRTVSTEQQQIAELQAEIQNLKHQRVVVEVRQELGRVMPYVLSGRSGAGLQPAVAAQPERANGSLAAGASETSPPAGVDSGAMPASVDCKKGARIS